MANAAASDHAGPPPDANAYALACASCRDDDRRFDMAAVAAYMGKAALDLSQPEQAHEWLQASEAVMAAFHDASADVFVSRSALAHAVALRMLHRDDEAEERLELALARTPASALLQRHAIDLAYATLYRDTGRRREAIALFEGMVRDADVRRTPDLFGRAIAGLAMCDHAHQGRFAQAMAELRRARVILDQPGGERWRLADIDQSIALMATLNKDDAALQYCVVALAGNAANPRADVAWRCLEVTAAAAMSSGFEALATLLFKMTVTSLQQLRQVRLAHDDDLADMALQSPTFAFDKVAGILLRQGRFGEAREVMALKLRSSVQLEEVGVPALTLGEEAAWARLKEAIGPQKQPPRSDELLHILLEIEYALEQSQEQVGRDIERLNQRLRQHSLTRLPAGALADTLVVHVIQDAATVSLAAHIGGLEIRPGRAHTTLSARDINEWVGEFVAAVMLETRAKREELGARLSEVLVLPLLDGLPPGVVRLLISAPGPLHNLPWAALPLGAGYLVERFDIVRATVPDVDLRRMPRAPMRLLACGCSAPGHPELPHAAEEVRQLEAFGLLDRPDRFTRDAFAAALPGATALHIASHFAAEPARIMQSRLLLGDGTEITLQAFAELGLSHLDLLVMSTCESGVGGSAQRGAEFAIDHILQATSVAAVMGTLFPVRDAATAELMRRFHAYLRGGHDKAWALAAAQRSFIRGDAGEAWRAPKFWAAPILSGNWLGWPATSVNAE